jgi:hypothetical protein|tara:strand:+ start:189 stop:548 length:360 start_codon:yes stop_codon:yes gene_type:complete
MKLVTEIKGHNKMSNKNKKTKLPRKTVLTAINEGIVSKEWFEEGLKAGLITQTSRTTEHTVVRDSKGNACKPRIMMTIVGKTGISKKSEWGPELTYAHDKMIKSFNQLGETHSHTITYK